MYIYKVNEGGQEGLIIIHSKQTISICNMYKYNKKNDVLIDIEIQD